VSITTAALVEIERRIRAIGRTGDGYVAAAPRCQQKPKKR